MKSESICEAAVSGSDDCEVLPITSLCQLDTLVGKYVTGVAPVVYWEDTCTQWRFDSLSEALEAMRDPFFTSFAPEQHRSRSSLREVNEYPCYTTELSAAMEVVRQLSLEAKPLSLRHASDQWSAGFPGAPGAEADSPAIAICLAALRTRSVEVRLELGLEEPYLRHGSLSHFE